jgi:hypothetical protein
MEGRVHNNCQNDSAGGTNKGALRVNHNPRQGSRGEGNNSNDDNCLSHRLGFDFEGKFHYQGKRQEVGRKKRARGRVLGKCSHERKEPLDDNNGIMTATEFPWFLVKGS